jgi:hypothetical protein
MRTLTSPSSSQTIVDTVKPAQGGLGSTTPAAAKTALNAVDTALVNMANGIAGLDQNGKILTSLIPDQGVTLIAVTGPKDVFVGAAATYVISNYDMFTTYNISPISGSVSRLKDVITYTAPHSVIPGGFIINGRRVTPTIKPAGPNAPTITSPTNNAAAVATSYTLTSSTFVQNGDTATHLSSDWQIATDSAFNTIVFSSMDSTVNKISFPVTGMVNGTSYFARVRYKANNGNTSDWSPVSTFTTAQATTLALTVSANVNNYNMRSAALSAGWNGILPLKLTVTVNNGVVIGSSTVAAFAFDTDVNYPVGSELSLINNGTIVGIAGSGGNAAQLTNGAPSGGGNGGNALRAQVTLAVTNNGTIAGGGGGGGSGSRGEWQTVNYSSSGGQTAACGGGGGSGAGFATGTGGITYANNFAGGGSFAVETNTPATPGASGTANNAGAGGVGGVSRANVSASTSQYSRGGNGGSGGGLGLPGAAGTVGAGSSYTAGAGGSAGSAVQGASNVAWLATGTRLGPLI